MTEDAKYKEFVQSKQIYESGTLVGAIMRESKHRMLLFFLARCQKQIRRQMRRTIG